MHTDSALVNTKTSSSFLSLLRTLGPGIMTATAAIGGSHLVSATKAGAIYGWQLLLVVVLVNVLKYPFFRASVLYTMTTGKSLIDGYAQMGRGFLWAFFPLIIFSGIVSCSAVVFFSAHLLEVFLPFDLPIGLACIFVVSSIVLIILAGHYQLLDKITKVIMMVLALTTTLALTIAIVKNPVNLPSQVVEPSIWSLSALGFVVVMMGWMPAPMEISCITSLWLVKQKQTSEVTYRSALFDFNLGYFSIIILAVFFLALGALILHGSGEPLATSGIGFANQLISLYAKTIGAWTYLLVAVIAFACMYGTSLTVLDGYARAIAKSQEVLFTSKTTIHCLNVKWLLLLAVVSVVILLFFASSLMVMLNLAMVCAFVTTPFFAWLNYRLVRDKIKGLLQHLSVIGLIYLFTFLLLFIAWKLHLFGL